MKSISRMCTKIKAGKQIELAHGIVIKNPSQFGVRLIVETPLELAPQSEALGREKSESTAR